MLYWGVFVFSLKMLFQNYERGVDIYLVDYGFIHKRLNNSDSFFYMLDDMEG